MDGKGRCGVHQNLVVKASFKLSLETGWRAQSVIVLLSEYQGIGFFIELRRGGEPKG